jgi:DNA replication protein DnaC
VTFDYKDYADGAKHKRMTIACEEFVRRLLLHILPARFVKLRHYGLLANRNRHVRIEQARSVLPSPPAPPEPPPTAEAAADAAPVPEAPLGLPVLFVMVLCWSRRLYLEFTLGQSQEQWLACHRHAFSYFGGATAQLMCDNTKTADRFRWDWPTKINELQIKNLFRLGFVEKKTNAILMGPCGIGKSHLATALGYEACQRGYSVLFTTAVDALNNLVAAHAAQRLKAELKKYLSPQLLVIDELGYLPLDKVGADLLFQIISQRYERGAIVITTNKAFKRWPEIFNNDAGVTSAILDRVLHGAETVIIEGKSFRMKDQIDPPPGT